MQRLIHPRSIEGLIEVAIMSSGYVATTFPVGKPADEGGRAIVQCFTVSAFFGERSINAATDDLRKRQAALASPGAYAARLLLCKLD